MCILYIPQKGGGCLLLKLKMFLTKADIGLNANMRECVSLSEYKTRKSYTNQRNKVISKGLKENIKEQDQLDKTLNPTVKGKQINQMEWNLPFS